MIAASVWLLLIAAIEEAQRKAFLGRLPVVGGFAVGGLFLFALDKFYLIFTRARNRPKDSKQN